MSRTVFGFEPPEDSPGFLLWQTTTVWQRLIKKSLEPYNISHAQFVVLAITLWFEGESREVSQSLIIKQSKLDKMTVSKSLKKLAAEGHIKRIEDKIDTRAKAIYLTKKGSTLISKLIPIIEKIDEDFFALLKKNDLRSLLGILNSLISAAEEFP